MSSMKAKSSWIMGLVKSMQDPALLLISSEYAVVIRDKYPKAKYHFLVLPKADIPSIYHVRPIVKRENLDLLNELYLLAQNAIEISGKKVDEFKIGFHAVPSMQRLHLHAISTDFHSACLKTKKHWNSFNTDLFLSYDHVLKEIKEKGSLCKISKEKKIDLENKELQCCHCDFVASNMPNLKTHLISHNTC